APGDTSPPGASLGAAGQAGAARSTGTADLSASAGRAAAGSPGAAAGRRGAAPASTAPARAGAGSAGGASGSAAAPAAPVRSPVVVGSVGNYSGPAGNSQAPGAVALQVFARYVNDRGGVAGHPVKVIVVDDGGDPARHQAAIKDLVENHGVLAFVANLASLTAPSARGYLEQKQVPVIGGEVSTPIWFDSPMFFPQGPNYKSLIRGMALAGKRLSGGKVKLGAMTCQEAEVCNNVDKWLFDEKFGQQAGLQPVYRGRISLTQPDFTAECLSARNAGVELLNVTGDPNTVGRVAASCDRQGYHPIFLQHSATVDNGTANAAGGRFKALLVTLTFPWVATGTPALDEYQAAMRAYKTSPSAATSMGWASAKLFARAAAALGEPPTRAQLLEGLYSLRDETLGGLTVPLNFRRGAPAVDSGCWFVLQAGEGRWQAPQQAAPGCP
ncbi:MAG TPA: ABC transporter substrate-binding protein, partial [Acidimicrobiia bacterium]|nr:ABC transporter substrate-binding protein [Acidimicrobiia bacterium]